MRLQLVGTWVKNIFWNLVPYLWRIMLYVACHVLIVACHICRHGATYLQARWSISADPVRDGPAQHRYRPCACPFAAMQAVSSIVAGPVHICQRCAASLQALCNILAGLVHYICRSCAAPLQALCTCFCKPCAHICKPSGWLADWSRWLAGLTNWAD